MTGPMILLYHRVATLDTDPQLLAVTPENFAAHLDVLREFSTPMSLADLVRATRAGAAPRNAVAITFDDGYADNLEHASPLLHARDIPANVFVATAGSDNACEFFWDDLDRILLQPGKLPEDLHLQIGNKTINLALHEDAHYSPAAAMRDKHWNVTQSEDPTARHRAYRSLCPALHSATIEERSRALHQLHEWSAQPTTPRPSHRMMTPAQMCELTRSALIDIGGHTVHHPLFSRESSEIQQREIQDCKTALQFILDREVTTFSYPFGGRRDYTPDTVAAVQQAGFLHACSNFPGHLLPGQDLYQLPRMLVRNCPGEQFRHWLLASQRTKETKDQSRFNLQLNPN
jgi:peptidoglycan/xylan/chitin deacetylase (PgdA/CDA1 family)